MRRNVLAALLLLPWMATPVFAQEASADPKVVADTLWVMITAMLVFFMNPGFAMVESGLCRAKNAVNILSKNFIVFAVSSLAFWVVGFGLMFGDGNGRLVGLTGWLLGRRRQQSRDGRRLPGRLFAR